MIVRKDQPDQARARERLTQLLEQALAAVEGRRVVRDAFRAQPLDEPCWICAIGKAAASMTQGACEALGPHIQGGLLITKAGHLNERQCDQFARHAIQCQIGGHPLPDAGSLAAGRALLDALAALPGSVTPLFLISGGASALIEVPASGLDLDALRRVNAWLLGSGLPIASMNAVRTALSRIKGGGLLDALGQRPARVLAISDVAGDDPRIIGSGLLVPRPALHSELAALELPDWLEHRVSDALRERNSIPAEGPVIELVATLTQARAAMVQAASRLGLVVREWPEFIDGDAAGRGRELAGQLCADPEPALHLWGGETTLHLPASPGAGGRNQHLALAAAMRLTGETRVALLAAGTDGSDGPTEEAGALVDGESTARMRAAGIDPENALMRADAARALAASGDLIRTGPTGTNVMDLMLGLRW